MRIALTNWTNSLVGGVETYLSTVAPALAEAGHDVGLLHETTQPGREPILPPDAVPTWDVAAMGGARCLTELREWRPDLIYSHGLLDPALERALVEVAPTVYFAHSYVGTCVSGGKAFKRPVVRACDRRFGLACLAHYYPHRCGGLNPVTMLSDYRRQSARISTLRQAAAIVTASQHMREEYLRHSFDADAVHALTFPVRAATPTGRESERPPPWHLLFAGRMDRLKGGSTLLDALPLTIQTLGGAVHLIAAGDGPERGAWRAQADRLQRATPRLTVEFPGWVSRAALDPLLERCHLLVLPSLWPEPFGQIGLEAATFGTPTAAFRVGGIGEWLDDGLNGALAPGAPAAPAALSDAIARCLVDFDRYGRLRAGARDTARRFTVRRHLDELTPILEAAASR